MDIRILDEKLENWILEQKLSEYAPKTLIDYKHAVKLFINYLKENDLTNIDKNTLLKYKEYLYDNFSLNTRNKYIVVLNKFLRYNNHPELTLKKFKTQKKSSLNDPISDQEHKRMLRWSKRLGMDDMYYMLKVFAYTGCRVNELRYFTVENIKNNYIENVFNKGKERILILRNDLKRELLAYCEEKKLKSGYIFVSPRNPEKMINESTIWRRLKKIAKAAKINSNKIHPHAWRHLFAKAAKEAGISLEELQDIFGHNDIRTTAIYTRTSNREKKDKLEKIKY